MDAEEAGIVSYTIDGYEDFQKENLRRKFCKMPKVPLIMRKTAFV